MNFTAEEEKLILATAGFDVDSTEIFTIKTKHKSTIRYYHDWQHALNVLSWVNVAALRLFNPEARAALSLAALYHDAVYDHALGSPENEKLSADLLPSDAILARHLVLLTSQHGKVDANEISDIGAYFLDCDMAAFLCDPRWEVVKTNDQNIRKELRVKHTEENVSRGRAEFLKKLLNKKSLFLSRYFHTEHDKLARQNLWHLVYG